jgi:predicted molibdopterin-dependent oxidoreductase YjgC
MTRRSRGTNERYPESLAEINPNDARKFGIVDGGKIKVSSRRGTLEVKANVTDRTPEGTIFMNFHFKESPVNMLTNPVLDPVCKIPELKVCACKIEAA